MICLKYPSNNNKNNNIISPIGEFSNAGNLFEYYNDHITCFYVNLFN